MSFNRTALIASALPAAIGCLEMPEPSNPPSPPPEVLDLRPSTGVGLDAIVTIALSSPVTIALESAPVTLLDESEAIVAAGVELGAGGYEIRLSPRPSWPSRARIRVAIAEGFVDPNGRPLLAGERELTFETAGDAASPPLLTVRSPAPARAAPLNLRSLAVALSPLPIDTPPASIVLESIDSGHTAVARVEEVSAEGVLFARLPEHRGPCQPLCPATRYRVTLGEDEANAADGPRGEVLTATIADVVAPVVTSTAVRRRGDRLIVEVTAAEPVRVRAAIRREEGEVESISAPAVPSECVFIESPIGLQPDAQYVFELEVEDLAGNVGRRIVVGAHTMPRIDAVITEIVPAPAHDWGNSDGLGVPFDGQPGFGTVSSADEWVEVVNLSSVPVDLRDSALVLRVIDSSPAETGLDGAPELYFGDGGSRERWWPGEALVIRTRGSIAQRGFILELASGSRVLDRVVVGEAPEAVARSGSPPDLDHESLARIGAHHFAWCIPTPGDPLPNPSCL